MSSARAQRRQLNADDVQAVVEIFAKKSALHSGLQILMRRRDDAHVDADRRLAAHAVELAFGEDAQEPRLQRSGHVADLIQEQRAAVGLLEPAAALRIRTGE